MDTSQVDAFSTVLGAIAAAAASGAEEGITETVKQAIGRARDQLVALVRSKFGDDTLGEAKLQVYADEPSPTNAASLRRHLVYARVDEDEQILALAQRILAQASPSATGAGSVAATIIHQSTSGSGHNHVGGVQHYGTTPHPS